MDSWLALAAGIAAVVVLEVVAVKAYRRYRANRQDPLGRPGAEPVAAALFAAQGYLAAAEEGLGRSLQAARAAQAADAQLLIEGMMEGAALQRGQIAALCAGAQPDAAEGLPQTEPQPAPPSADTPDGAPLWADQMGCYAVQAATWAFDVAPAAAELARRHRCRKAAKALRIAGEVESCHAEVAEALADGSSDASHEVSLCPTCGFIVFGRRPAFCTACGQPGFEMRALRKGLLD